ncbi:MAG: DUF4358 domain-containing protein [Clostridia bacterium]|nr:DUF4358 domain-containing protein [Clostridia bacterium]
MKKNLFLLLILAVSLVSCSEKTVDLPAPDALFSAINDTVELAEMVDVSEDFLESNLGILDGDYDSAVYYIPAIGSSCEEIIIVRAKDEAAAARNYEKLEARLAYVEKSAGNYLTEHLPMIANAMLRRDGLTASLVISDHVKEIETIYNGYTK